MTVRGVSERGMCERKPRRRLRKADAELKARTPHRDVGNKPFKLNLCV